MFEINGKTKLLGLFGYPVEHTASPAMHNAGFKALGLNCRYLPFEIRTADFDAAINSLVPLGFMGINVTVPYKQSAFWMLENLSEEAKLIEAVNTISVKGRKLKGYNTDAAGFVLSLKHDALFSLKNKVMVLYGTGGAGRAVAFAAALEGIKRIVMLDAKKNMLESLEKSLKEKFPKVDVQAVDLKDSLIKQYIAEADILVNATPLGLKEKDPLVVDAGHLHSGLLVYDLVYNPLETKLLKAAKAKGAKAVSGLGMLLFQGVKAFEIWTGQKAPVAVMKRALKKAIF